MQRPRVQAVGQFLGPLPVPALTQRIIRQLVADPRRLQLMGQPGVTVEVDLQPQRQPSGHPHVNQPQHRVHPIQVVVQASSPAHNDLRIPVGTGVARVKDHRRFLHRKHVHQSRMRAPGLQDRGHPILLPKVLAGDHLDLHPVLARQSDNVLPHLLRDRLSKPGQVPRLKPRRPASTPAKPQGGRHQSASHA